MQLPFMPSSSSHPRSVARTSSFSSSALASSAVVVVVLFWGTSSGIMGMLQRKRWPSSTTASYVCSSASSAFGASAGLSRFDSSCVSCELAIDELELGDACCERSDVASFSVMYESGHITSYCHRISISSQCTSHAYAPHLRKCEYVVKDAECVLACERYAQDRRKRPKVPHVEM